MYLSIASYRDPMLQSTIDSAFKNASNPENLFVGCFISIISSEPNFKNHLVSNNYNNKVFYEVEEAGTIFSVTRARNKSNQWLKKDHDYVIQVDSHTRFLPGWDSKLIDSYNRLNKQNVLFSTYLPSWFPNLDGTETYRDWKSNEFPMFASYEKGKHELFDTYEIVPTMLAKHNPSKKHFKGWHMAGMFQFGPVDYYLSNPQPEWIVFWGEELYNSLRAFTLGWDVYIPDVMPLRQMYPQDVSKDVGEKIWGEECSPHKNWKDFPDWKKKAEEATDKIIDAIIFETIGPEHLGTKRKLKELYDLLGYDVGKMYEGWRNEYRKIH
jgi:hypothetical protein